MPCQGSARVTEADLIAARDRQFLRHFVVKGFRHRQGDEDRGDFHRVSRSGMTATMKLFLDTADVSVIKDMVPTGLVDGVTTNPSLIAKSGRNIAEVIAEICALVEGPISAEAVATDFETMVREGDKLVQTRNDYVAGLMNGQIVVARLGDDVTVKRFHRHKNQIELHAENPDYPTIVVQPGDPFEIEGRAVGLIRNSMLM